MINEVVFITHSINGFSIIKRPIKDSYKEEYGNLWIEFSDDLIPGKCCLLDKDIDLPFDSLPFKFATRTLEDAEYVISSTLDIEIKREQEKIRKKEELKEKILSEIERFKNEI